MKDVILQESSCKILYTSQDQSFSWTPGGILCLVTEYWILCLVTQFCPTLCHPMDYCLPGSFVHGQEYWSGLPCPPSGDLPNPEIKPRSPALPADFLTIWDTREAHQIIREMWTKTAMWYHLIWSGWPSSKYLQTVNAREGVQRKELSYEVCGDVNWCSHFGEQFLKNGNTVWSSSPTPGYITREKSWFKSIHAPQCSLQHYSK